VPDTSWPPRSGDSGPAGAGTADAGPQRAPAQDSADHSQDAPAEDSPDDSQSDPARQSGWRPLPPSPRWASLTWLLLLWLLSLIIFIAFARREVLPFYLVWLGFALLWGFRVSGVKPTLWVASTMIATAVATVGIDAARRDDPAEELAAVVLMAAVFLIVVWQMHRSQSASAEQARASEEKGRLLATQRRFLQDASHQLRTPITIALGHAELLAGELAGRGEQRDIHVVVGELTRLKRLSERLLLIAASEDPGFLKPEPVELDDFLMEVLGRWMPAAQRHWRVGGIEAVTVRADRERLGLAVDALLENAVRHTANGDVISLSVRHGDDEAEACLVVEDTGEGIAAEELDSIFERFQTGSGDSRSRGTGLGLALVRAITHGHGGEVRVHSTLGAGSKFELMLPAMPGLPAATPPRHRPGSTAQPVQADGPTIATKLKLR
jgi:signal transduction histidine kinase